MYQKKIGGLLRELRRERGLTQEQLAEQFDVSARTVSRWETGSNLPELSMLIELADFYGADIREIIDGERKREDMDCEEKAKLQSVADYADKEKTLLLRRLRVISAVGLIALIAAPVLADITQAHPSPIMGYVSGFSYGLGVGALVTALLYATGALAKIRRFKLCTPRRRAVLIGVATLFVVFTLIAAIAASVKG